jgi:signal transduction histidine kinase
LGGGPTAPETRRPEVAEGDERPWPVVRFSRILLAGTALGLFAGSLSTAFTLLSGRLLWTNREVTASFLPRVVLLNLVYWWVWAALAPAALRLAHRFPIERTRWARPLLVHLGGGLTLSLAHIAAVGGARHWLYGSVEGSTALANVQSAFFRILDWDLVAYFGIVGFGHAVDYYRRAEARSRRAALVQAQLVEAQLLALQRQLQPHLLFNTLHDVSVLMQRDVEAARRMLFRLSDLLRHALRSLGVHETSLEDEIDFARRYAEIEAARFPDRFRVEFDVPEAALGAAVPTMLLQPLLENAIKHGVDDRSGAPGLITVSSRAENGALVIEVRDHGPGLSRRASDERPGLGIGLANTRSRLQHLYPAAHRFELSEAEGGGVRATVRIPFRPAPVPRTATG